MKAKIILFAFALALVFSSCFRNKKCTCETVEYENGAEVYRETFTHTSRMSKTLCSAFEQETTFGTDKSVTTCNVE